MKQAILVVTHVRSARVLAHVERLRRETEGLLPVFVCVDERRRRDDTVEGFPGDFRASRDAAQIALPMRLLDQETVQYLDGFSDLFYAPALMSPRLEAFEHVWVVEADVDFAGDWGAFFEPAMRCTADLVGTTLTPRPALPRWIHWSMFRCPAYLPKDRQIRGFFPLARLSRRMVQAYRLAAMDRSWGGHYEAIWPTLALACGYPVADLGGEGPFRWGGRSFYTNTPGAAKLSPGSFVWRPERRFYFHEDEGAFPEAGLLYHPVKGWGDAAPPDA